MITLVKIESKSDCLILIIQYIVQYLILALSNHYELINKWLYHKSNEKFQKCTLKLAVIHAMLHKTTSTR